MRFWATNYQILDAKRLVILSDKELHSFDSNAISI